MVCTTGMVEWIMSLRRSHQLFPLATRKPAQLVVASAATHFPKHVYVAGNKTNSCVHRLKHMHHLEQMSSTLSKISEQVKHQRSTQVYLRDCHPRLYREFKWRLEMQQESEHRVSAKCFTKGIPQVLAKLVPMPPPALLKPTNT